MRLEETLVFGERPGPRTDPLRPLYPHTTTGAAANLINLLEVTVSDYLQKTQRFNVFNDDGEELSLNMARERVQAIMTRHIYESSSPRFLFVGKEALRAGPQFYRNMEFLEIRDAVMLLPHTSGVNRWYNLPENRAAAREKLAEFLA